MAWISFGASPCRRGKNNLMRVLVSMLLKSRASPDMLRFIFCGKKRIAIRPMKRPLFPKTLSIPSNDIGKQVGLRIYKHPLLQHKTATVVETRVRKLPSRKNHLERYHITKVLILSVFILVIPVSNITWGSGHSEFYVNFVFPLSQIRDRVLKQVTFASFQIIW